ncbi:MBL fold metallo-hydrolase [Clostridium botulinum C]|uniref:MBL fold metallo-hydrolase n=2 Tax=Clostridium botulinum TaxID=1491 RepID=A0A9Q4TIQ1_CLOBO|nr:MBL fold metallo-hydrolase [Clostridium botulinum]MCD3195439.1 MBL fold metallo-hydrolase [Clostridium botulinum C]MCD3200855.1 MBL fold metallo-hydrolase [Clostridium botulinum C]MCD3206263.1 MBL fold metallo-hydrolase [Clostridium botulinum C]MCD3208781.1 MBL fold metallo-hydrolase [Clostridium botulinum C]MCD3225991.1 MBL fold metallo-hydrolase [Clostridium botulinum C]
MEITWFGHSSFLIKTKNGKQILTDPFDKTVGYKTYQDTTDIVTISHHHYDHDYTNDIKGAIDIIDSCGTFKKHDVLIKGIPSYHDKSNGSKRGKNIIYIIKADNFNICHLGDLGHKLSKEDIKAIGDIDILLIPVGGIYTINGIDASSIAKDINPKIIIPMHYKTTYLSFALDSVDTFINNMNNVKKLSCSTLKITKPLDEHCAVKILIPSAQ